MMIDLALLHIICAPFSHSNIKYTAFRVVLEHMLQKTIDAFNIIHLEAKEYGIVYTTSIKFTHEVARQLHIPAYTSCILLDDKENKEEKSCIFQA